MIRSGRLQKITSFFLIIAAIILFLKWVWSNNVQTRTIVQPENTNTVKFDFYTMLPKQAVATTVPRASGLGDVMLQLGSSKELKDVESMQNEWQKMGYPTFIQKYQTESQVVWYRLLLGPFPNTSVAEQIQQQLKQKHYDSILLRAP
jgi:cell division septation protein DedD